MTERKGFGLAFPRPEGGPMDPRDPNCAYAFSKRGRRFNDLPPRRLTNADTFWHNRFMDWLAHAVVRFDSWLWRKRWGGDEPNP